MRVLLLDGEDFLEPNETEWMEMAMSSGAYDFLMDPKEDIYSLRDGKPYSDEG